MRFQYLYNNIVLGSIEGQSPQPPNWIVYAEENVNVVFLI